MGTINSIILKNRISELERLSAFVEGFSETHSIPQKAAFEINLALDELFTNVVSYAFPQEENHEVHLTIERREDSVVMTMQDQGIPFNPLEAETPDTERPLEERQIGGLGIHFVRKVMDHLDYRRESDRNIVVLTKHITDET